MKNRKVLRNEIEKLDRYFKTDLDVLFKKLADELLPKSSTDGWVDFIRGMGYLLHLLPKETIHDFGARWKSVNFYLTRIQRWLCTQSLEKIALTAEVPIPDDPDLPLAIAIMDLLYQKAPRSLIGRGNVMIVSIIITKIGFEDFCARGQHPELHSAG